MAATELRNERATRVDIEGFFARDVMAFTRALAELDSQIAPDAEARADDRFRSLTQAIRLSLDACRRIESEMGHDRARILETQKRFQQVISPWFDRSWFMHRAKTKPRGYPGDYELLAAIYDGAPKSRGLGGYLDLYFLNTELGRAVPARLKAAKNFLIEEIARRRGDVSILNVACGPCREYEGGIADRQRSSVHVTCIDNDQQALDYVRARILTVSGIPDVHCACYNALRMRSAGATIRRFGRPDIIYSVGLCDYLPDKALVGMLRGWRDSLNDGGVLYVAFKDSRRYDKTPYQWHVDWYFFQRTAEQCRRLYEQAGFDPERLEMSRDETGVIINFISRLAPQRIIRVDVLDPVAGAEPTPAASALAREASQGVS